MPQGPRHLPLPPKPEETLFSWAVTAVFEVALDSCRCTCAGSRGLCGMEQTAPYSLGNSVTSQRCCKAESKGRQVRDASHSKPATPPSQHPSQGWVMGPGLNNFASSSFVSLLICHLQHHRSCNAFGLRISTYTFLLLTCCLAGVSFYRQQFLPPEVPPTRPVCKATHIPSSLDEMVPPGHPQHEG